MKIRATLSVGLVAALLGLGGIARAGDAASPPAEPDPSVHVCAHHVKAMRAMATKKQRQAYCQAHKDCMSHDCGGLGPKEQDKSHIDPPGPTAKPKAPPAQPKN